MFNQLKDIIQWCSCRLPLMLEAGTWYVQNKPMSFWSYESGNLCNLTAIAITCHIWHMQSSAAPGQAVQHPKKSSKQKYRKHVNENRWHAKSCAAIAYQLMISTSIPFLKVSTDTHTLWPILWHTTTAIFQYPSMTISFSSNNHILGSKEAPQPHLPEALGFCVTCIKLARTQPVIWKACVSSCLNQQAWCASGYLQTWQNKQSVEGQL